MKRETLYSKNEADFLSERENELSYDKEKMDVILDNIGEIESFLEIGCGSGQIIKEVVKKVPYVVGVDESPDRIKIAKTNCKEAEFLVAKSDELDYIEVFDVVLTSQMLHEVKMFGNPEEIVNALAVVYRALKPDGKYLLLDHRDPGEGSLEVSLKAKTKKLYLEFCKNFRKRQVYFRKLDEGRYEISKRDYQDFVTKFWSLNTPMEEIEMNETHASFSKAEAEKLVQKAGFTVNKFVTFTYINESLTFNKITLEPKYRPWNRKFLLVARKY